jgi:hypothetical protein
MTAYLEVKLRRPNLNNPLNRLSEEQAAGVEYYSRTHNLTETVEWLARNGVKSNTTSLSNWLNRGRLRQSFDAAKFETNEYKEWCLERFPTISQRELDRRANMIFQLKALRYHDPRTYLAVNAARHKAKVDQAKLTQRERALALAREKWLAAQRTKIEAGLDALYLEVKDNKEAVELFQKFKAVATKATP